MVRWWNSVWIVSKTVGGGWLGSGTTIGMSSLAAALGDGADVKVVVGGISSDGEVGPAPPPDPCEVDCFLPSPPHARFSFPLLGVGDLPSDAPPGAGLSNGFDLLATGLAGPLPANGQFDSVTCFSGGSDLNNSDPAGGPRGETGGGIEG